MILKGEYVNNMDLNILFQGYDRNWERINILDIEGIPPKDRAEIGKV